MPFHRDKHCMVVLLTFIVTVLCNFGKTLWQFFCHLVEMHCASSIGIVTIDLNTSFKCK